MIIGYVSVSLRHFLEALIHDKFMTNPISFIGKHFFNIFWGRLTQKFGCLVTLSGWHPIQHIQFCVCILYICIILVNCQYLRLYDTKPVWYKENANSKLTFIMVLAKMAIPLFLTLCECVWVSTSPKVLKMPLWLHTCLYSNILHCWHKIVLEIVYTLRYISLSSLNSKI